MEVAPPHKLLPPLPLFTLLTLLTPVKLFNVYTSYTASDASLITQCSYDQIKSEKKTQKQAIDFSCPWT